METEKEIGNKVLNKPIILLSFFILFSFRTINSSELILETIVNDEFKLRSPFQFGIIHSKELQLQVEDNGTEYVIFQNRNQNEYLKLIKNEGSEDGIFSQAEIGKIGLLKNQRYLPSKSISFRTNSNIHLGMSLQELEKIKGNNYLLSITKRDSVLTYIYDLTKYEMLSEKFKMPTYHLIVGIKENKIKKINFGFDQP